MSDVPAGLIVVVLVFLVWFGGFAAGDNAARRAEQSLAVEAGVGRWVVNPRTGERTFYYGSEEAFAK